MKFSCERRARFIQHEASCVKAFLDCCNRIGSTHSAPLGLTQSESTCLWASQRGEARSERGGPGLMGEGLLRGRRAWSEQGSWPEWGGSIKPRSGLRGEGMV